MGEGRRSLVSIFAVAVLLTFFAEKPIGFSWSGVKVEERYIWLCLLVALLYCVAMAYTKRAFRSVNIGHGTWREYLQNSDNRPVRIGEIFSIYVSRFCAIGAIVLIGFGLYGSFVTRSCGL